MQISTQGTGGWWVLSGYDWDSADVYNKTSSTGNVTVNWYITSLPQFNSGVKYRVVSRATDNALNVEVKYSTITFVYDVTEPTATVNRPGAAVEYYGPNKALGTITGTSNEVAPFVGAEVSGVSQVLVRISSGSTTKSYWQVGTGQWVVGASSWSVVNGTNPWTFAAPN